MLPTLVPVLEDALDGGHLVLELGALAHAPLEHAGQPDALGDGQAHGAAVRPLAHHEEAHGHEADVDQAEDVEVEAEGARGRDEDEPGRGVEVLVLVELVDEGLVGVERADRRQALEAGAQVSEHR